MKKIIKKITSKRNRFKLEIKQVYTRVLYVLNRRLHISLSLSLLKNLYIYLL